MGDNNDRKMSSTQLDSHANMVSVGKKTCIIQSYGKSSDARPLSNECSNMKRVPIIYAELEYNFKHTIKTYLLMMSNTIYITSMEKNLIPPFIMHEADILVNGVARIHYGEDVSYKSQSNIVQE